MEVLNINFKINRIMKKKTINELYTQLVKAHKEYKSGGMRLLFAYNRAFIQHFGVEPHTKECNLFIKKYGKYYAM